MAAARLDPTIRRLGGLWLRHPARLLWVAGALAVLTGSRLGLTWLVKAWAEGPLATGDPAGMPALLVGSTGLALLLVVASFVARYAQASLDQRVLAGLRGAAAARLMRTELATVRRQATGEAMSRLAGDFGQLGGAGDLLVRRRVGDLVLGLGALGLMLLLDPWLTALLVVLLPPAARVLGRLGRRLRQRLAAHQAATGELQGLLGRQVRALAAIKAGTAEAAETARFVEASELVARGALRGERLAALAAAALWVFATVALLALLTVGTWRVSAGNTTPGGLLAFALLAAQAIEALRRLAGVRAARPRMLAAARRVFELIDLEPVEAAGVVSLPGPRRGELRLLEVSFAWPPRPASPADRAIARLDLTLSPASQVALVGASGAGKSTLATLLVRLVRPQSGRIRLDGVDVGELDVRELRRAVCLLSREPYLFAATVRENLVHGAGLVEPDAVAAAARLVGLGPWLETLPRGLESPLDGADVSVTERQRIALARAVLRDPAVLVLDEATSSLEEEVEARIFDDLAAWLTRRTVLLISHRLAAVRRMARVVVLDGGVIAADGTLGEVLAASPLARALFARELAGEAAALAHTPAAGVALGSWPGDEAGGQRPPVLWT